MGLFGTALAVGGAVASFIGSKKSGDAAEDNAKANAKAVREAAKHNKEISLYDRSVILETIPEIEKSYGENVKVHRDYMDALLGSQITSFAKKGVAAGTGTPVQVTKDTINQATREIDSIKYEGQKAKERAKSLAKRYKMLADAGIKESMNYANLIEETGKNQKTASTISGFGNLAGNIFNIGGNLGWWK